MLGIFREYSKRREIDNELQDLQKELAQLQNQKDNFLNLLDMYQSDFFVEQEARTKFNYQKAGEKVVVIDEEINNLKLAQQDINNNEKKQENIVISRNLVAWWDYFFAQQKFN